MNVSKRVAHLVQDFAPCVHTAAEHRCRRHPFGAHAHEGYIDLSVAQNSIMFDVLQERIGSLQIHGEKLEYADEWYGSTRMREHCSKFLNKYLGYACTPESVDYLSSRS